MSPPAHPTAHLASLVVPWVVFALACGGPAVHTAAQAQPDPTPRDTTSWTTVVDYHHELTAQLLTEDGRHLIASAGRYVCLLEVESGATRACGASGDVTSAALSPDGQRFAVGTFAGGVEIWDIATWRRVRRFEGHEHVVDDLVWLDDDTLASASWDGTVRRWPGGEVMRQAPPHTEFRALARGPASSLAVAEDETVLVLDANEQLVGRYELGESVVALAFAPRDGRLAVALYDGSVLLIEEAATSAREARRWQAFPEYTGELAWLDDERLLVTGRGAPIAVIGLDHDQIERIPIERQYGTPRIAMARDHARLVVSGDGGVQLIPIGPELQPTMIRPSRATGLHAAFDTHEGHVAVNLGSDVLLITPASVRVIASDDAGTELDRAPAIAAGPRGAWAIARPDGAVALFDASGVETHRVETTGQFEYYGFHGETRTTGRVEIHVATPPRHITWSGARLAVAAGELIQIFDTRTMQREQVIRDPLDEVTALALSRDGARLAYGDGHGFTVVVDLGLRDPRLYGQTHSSVLSGIAFSPDGAAVATAGQDGHVRVFDVAARRLRFEVRHADDYVLAVAWSPDGGRLASTTLGRMFLWSASDGSPRATLEQSFPSSPWNVAFPVDGRFVAAYEGGLARFVDLRELRRTLEVYPFMIDGAPAAVFVDGQGHFDVVGAAPARVPIRARGEGDVRTAPMRTAAEVPGLQQPGLAAAYFAARR